jgi:hypothetical protein
MSYLPLSSPLGSEKTIRNRGWQWYNNTGTAPTNFHYRFQGPCIGVTDDDGVYRHDCTSPSVNIVTDLCGKPFRTGSNFVVQTATGSGAPPCGGRRNR